VRGEIALEGAAIDRDDDGMPPPQPIRHADPYGWYFVGYSDELAPGELRSLRYFGRDLVLFRGESGQPGMLGASCPHQGIHLGKGGKVDGELIRCPFHSWGFDAEGWCRDIPYAPTMPKVCYRQALTHGYPLREANGVIWAWRHPQNIPPLFEVEAYPEFADVDWAAQTRFEWRRAISPQGVAAATPLIHAALGATAHGHDVYEDHIRRSVAEDGGDAALTGGSTVHSATHGPGFTVMRLHGPVTVSLMVLATPVEDGEAEVRFAFTHPKVETQSPQATALAEVCARMTQLPIPDQGINRTGLASHLTDDQSQRFRQWFEQFYVYEEQPQDAAAE
jgi:3-ketosteroid 9alpha-monooxygenase subunit A